MKNESIKIFQKKKNDILEKWYAGQTEDDGLREDLMSNEDLRVQSEELLSSIINNLNDANIDDPQSDDFSDIREILSSISISRAKQGFSPRETGGYIYSLKQALLQTLSDEITDPVALYKQSMAINKIMDS